MTTIDVSVRPFRVEFTVTTEIPAPPERAWDVLARTGDYPQWNPFVRRFAGDLAVGAQVEVDLKAGKREPRTMRPRIVEVDPGRSFTWLGQFWAPGLLAARHRFTIEAAGDGSRLVQWERISGLLAPLFRVLLTRDTLVAFAALNDALAERAQQQPSGPRQPA